MLVPTPSELRACPAPARLAVLGATGSIGTSALAIVREHREDFAVVALSAHRQWQKLLPLIEEFSPAIVSLADEGARRELCAALGQRSSKSSVLSAPEFYRYIEQGEFDIALCASVGFDGIHGSLAAAHSGRRVALANKESIVAAGALLRSAASSSGAQIVPVDSEHSSIYQLLLGHADEQVESCLLTASGGPFLDLPLAAWTSISPEQAVRHPRWSMGPKISIDSATMFNKGLELIEAHWLFGFAESMIDVVVHPESFVHGALLFADGSLICHAGATDMRLPIAFALRCPAPRYYRPAPLKSLTSMGVLSFRQLDTERFRAVALARHALRQGGVAPAVLTIANDIAVERFIRGENSFLDIIKQVEDALSRFGGGSYQELGDLLELQQRIANDLAR
ncbi:MAG: 1-deoxy-D-xylulose-5-phosphate reductoisomerase [Bdellovibrionota bacterium]|nr:MAG: 1-deoxy-D-xylulose-5-phosphate reductoisomerase [Bdellovibrionota bacterium]